MLADIIVRMKTLENVLGGLTVDEFLREYWQKKPLLIRQALPTFNGLLSPDELIKLACTDDVQARLVTQQRGNFNLHHGPFEPDDFSRLGKSKWTVLVQGVNQHLQEAADLLKHFSFIPHARLDDLMVSYAPKGGGVGPHFDSYDVFLLQGLGQRRWQISAQADRSLLENAPLRILRDFKGEQEWVLEAGDMLYLPPHYAHHGLAEGDCMTYSIGFRAPAYQELAEQFLVYLQDRIELEGMYADPDLQTQTHPSELSAAMLRQVEQAIKQVRWDREDIANFLGCYLTEPKAHVFFEAPVRPVKQPRFFQLSQKQGVTLNMKSQMLCHADWIFMNGEASQVSQQTYTVLRKLADKRALRELVADVPELTALLYQWYLYGYLEIVKN